MSFLRVWVHIVWGTKNKKKVLTEHVRKELFDHILLNAKEKNIYLDTINGYLDHVHCLISMNADLSISKVVQLLKGESAYWANKNNLIAPQKLAWSDDYYAISVSDSFVPKVRRYIRNQEQKHKELTFSQSYQEFIKNYEF
jgi:REP element-mobilizing transposase RayT